MLETQSKIQEIQTILGVKVDGIWGTKSQAALDDLVRRGAHAVMASSFADPADVAAFKNCKAQGGSDQECFKSGDNGVGMWGDDTTADRPMCALPPEDWQILGSRARGAKVLVNVADRKVVCELRDTMPRRKNITNGAGIDLNPAAARDLGLTPPFLTPATWRWA